MRGTIHKKIVQAGMLALLGGGTVTAAHAQSQTLAQNLLTDPFVFTAGIFLVGTDVDANLNGQSGTNPAVNFDRTFGTASDKTRGRVEGLWRINPRHSLRAAYFNNDVTRSRVLDRDIQWGDNTFNAGANVQSTTKYSVYELAYDYTFMRTPTYEVAGSLGMHFTDLKLSLSGTGTATGGGSTVTGLISREGKIPAPLPVIGVRGGWAVAPSILLDGRLEFFKLSGGGYDGHWANAHVGATWMFSRHFGVGLGYDKFTTRLQLEKNDFNGQLKFGYSGLMAFVTGTF
ncbi:MULTISPECIES: hypothetical protein [Ramlibacter]|uniref:Outer membrane protein beta-barrel domain-containing protein n=1 Tax=Ramlibacter pinisoli TaxID=2682844 RepID=A0A6N8IVP4_9BURK|nr:MULTISPECIES: hypothetical protein [Ramlibacter]MBA2960922.1 hypothetical protein [Ramlibacter sp. CGMCC 1.13660]MVQ30868.1 hypothetical protein [Ramlibacter pinisoli]